MRTRHKEWSSRFWRRSLRLLTVMFLAALLLGDTVQYWRASFYLWRHRKPDQPILLDQSQSWFRPRLSRGLVVENRYSLPSWLQKSTHTVWVLEHRRTGLAAAIPPRWFCQDTVFGWWNGFRVRRCEPTQAEPIVLHKHLRKAKLTYDDKACRWSGEKCRFGASWRWSGVRHSFSSGGVARTCVYMHPLPNGWMRARFPALPMDRGLQFVFGFQDNKASDVPMRVQLRLFPNLSATKASRMLLDREIAHRSGWHGHFFSAKKLRTKRAALEFRMKTSHVGAKAFCFQGFLYTATPPKGGR